MAAHTNPSSDLTAIIEQRIQALTVDELARLTAQVSRVQADHFDIIAIDEAAAFLKIHPITLRRNAVTWGIPHKRMGTEWRFLAQTPTRMGTGRRGSGLNDAIPAIAGIFSARMFPPARRNKASVRASIN